MLADRVIDASVLAAALFKEDATARARERLRQNLLLVAPDLLLVEMASIASKKVRRSLATVDEADAALDKIGGLVREMVPATPYYRRSFQLAASHGVSAYDGLYLAIAEHRGLRVLTDDRKLVQRAIAAGLADLLDPL